MTNEEWHKFYLNIAKQYANLSKDPNLKVGAILVPSDFSKIISVGYNGWEKGGTNQRDSLEEGKSGAVHAECNCLIKADPDFCKEMLLFCSHSACKVCARMIINFGNITHFIYETDYRDTSGLDILRERGIVVVKV
jgi:dCMP deaminase